MPRKILLIDDDERLIQLLSEYLAQFDMTVVALPHPGGAEAVLAREKPDLVLLDVMLPEKSGLDVCREIRQGNDVPIIMLTARGEVTDRIVGLELGADDYLAKPFEPRELLARIQSVLRRQEPRPPIRLPAASFNFGTLEIDVTRRSVFLKGKPLDLTTMEFDALVLFASHPGKVLSRDEIMEGLRGCDWAAFDRSIDVLMSRLRQKLKDNPKKPSFFKTVWGTGYVFIASETPAEKGKGT